MLHFFRDLLIGISEQLNKTLSQEYYGYVMPNIEKYVINVMKCFVDGDIEEFLNFGNIDVLKIVDEQEREKRLKAWIIECESIEDEKNIMSYKFYDVIYNAIDKVLEPLIDESWYDEEHI